MKKIIEHAKLEIVKLEKRTEELETQNNPESQNWHKCLMYDRITARCHVWKEVIKLHNWMGVGWRKFPDFDNGRLDGIDLFVKTDYGAVYESEVYWSEENNCWMSIPHATETESNVVTHYLTDEDMQGLPDRRVSLDPNEQAPALKKTNEVIEKIRKEKAIAEMMRQTPHMRIYSPEYYEGYVQAFEMAMRIIESN